MKILALNNLEETKKKIMERVAAKYSNKDRVPTAYERFVWLVNFLYPYFKTFKTIMTIFTPSKHKLMTSTDLPNLFFIYSSYLDMVCKEFQTRLEDHFLRISWLSSILEGRRKR